MKKPKKRSKYLDLQGRYVDLPFNRVLTRRYMQGRIEFVYYKGHVLLSIQPESHRLRDTHASKAWLNGADLDALLVLVRKAKQHWVRGHMAARREIAKQERRGW